jgi:hypothetical protein
MSSPVASANDNNTGGRVGRDRAQESEALTRRDPGGSIRHSVQNSDINYEERQAAISRQQVTNITKTFDKKMKFTGEIGNGNISLDQTISAYRSICQDIAASDVLCVAKHETSVDIMRRRLCCNFFRKSRL